MAQIANSNLESFSEFVTRLDKLPETSLFGPDVIYKLEQRETYTEDFSKLRKYENHIVFIWDWKVKRSGRDNGVIFDYDYSHYLGEAYTATLAYEMRETVDCLHTAPFTSHKMNLVDRAYVTGEAFAVSAETILDLDRYYKNGVEYQREERNIFLTQQKLHGQEFKGIGARAFIYMGVPGHWEKYNTRRKTKMNNEKLKKMVWVA